MDRSEKIILTNMCMIYDDKGNILVQNKIDDSYCGITFPGGHIEKGESFCGSVIREVMEETGLAIKNPTLCGVKQFKYSGGDRYIVFLYKTNNFSGELKSSDEGEVFWIKEDEIKKIPTENKAVDFDDLLKIFTDDNKSEFYYYLDNNEWKYSLL